MLKSLVALSLILYSPVDNGNKFQTMHPSGPSYLRHVVEARCGGVVYKASYELDKAKGRFLFNDIVVDGKPVKGSGRQVDDLLRDKYLEGFSFMSCSAYARQRQKPKFIARLLDVTKGPWHEVSSIQTFELSGNMIIAT